VPRRTLRSEQKRWLRGLTRIFGSECVAEWPAFAPSVDRYSPRLDLAVGPFSTEAGHRKTEDYRRLAIDHSTFLDTLWSFHVENERRLGAKSDQSPQSLDFALSGNNNARCFLAVEIENAVSRKHLMGGIMNAAALGHLGVMVAWTEEKLRAMFRARSYLFFLESVDKPTMTVRNLLILSRNQADRAFTSGVLLPNER